MKLEHSEFKMSNFSTTTLIITCTIKKVNEIFLTINMEHPIGNLNAMAEWVSKFTVARNYHLDLEHGFT